MFVNENIQSWLKDCYVSTKTSEMGGIWMTCLLEKRSIHIAVELASPAY